MNVIDTDFEGLKIIELDVFGDGRGRFLETYNARRYSQEGIHCAFLQDNVSVSQRGVLRGMHWQTGRSAQSKLVSVLSGAVFDAVVDIRPGSGTFGRVFTTELSSANGRQLFIPRGFAHGFMSLEDNTIFSYKCDNLYDKASERGFRYDDPEVRIPWPDIGCERILSPKDLAHPSFRDALAAL